CRHQHRLCLHRHCCGYPHPPREMVVMSVLMVPSVQLVVVQLAMQLEMDRQACHYSHHRRRHHHPCRVNANAAWSRLGKSSPCLDHHRGHHHPCLDRHLVSCPATNLHPQFQHPP